jgi:RNA polymerase sigma factor (sigma-70 family)
MKSMPWSEGGEPQRLGEQTAFIEFPKCEATSPTRPTSDAEWNSFIENHAEASLRYARPLVPSVQDAEDAVQVAFMQFHMQHICEDVPWPDAPMAMLRSIIWRRCMDILRQRYRHPESPRGTDDPSPGGGDADPASLDPLKSMEARDWVAAAWPRANLNAMEEKILIRYEYQGMTHEAIAREEGLTGARINQIKKAAKAKLERALKEVAGGCFHD